MSVDLATLAAKDRYRLLDSADDSLPRGGEYVRRFLDARFGDRYDIDADFPLVPERGKRRGTETYPISSTRPIESPTDANVAVTGGAMGATSAFHEGGYYLAMRTGTIAGRLAEPIASTGTTRPGGPRSARTCGWVSL